MNGRYLTYQEYTELGGSLDESAFSSYITDAEHKLDYFTFNRLRNATTIPSEVKELLTKYVDYLNKGDTSINKVAGLTSYGNGIETFGWSSDADRKKAINRDLVTMLNEYLSAYPELTNRGIRNANDNNTSE